MVAESVPWRTRDPVKSAVLLNGRTFRRRVDQGPERPGQAADVPRKLGKIRRLSLFSFRIHMSLVSSVSQMLMDKCEAARIPIPLTVVTAQGEASLKCCIQTYYSLALIRTGSVQTLVALLRNPTEQRHGILYTAETRQIHRTVNML